MTTLALPREVGSACRKAHIFAHCWRAVWQNSLKRMSVVVKTHAFLRCLRITRQLNDSHQWDLSTETQRRYAEKIVELCPNLDMLRDDQLCTMIRNYHAEHNIVEALCQRDHPQHAECWVLWSQRAIRLLNTRYRNISGTDATVVSSDDLAQEAMHDLWYALHTFRYESSFQTWAFIVISNSFVKAYRVMHTQKRSAPHKPMPLEDLESAKHLTSCYDIPAPDEIALSQTFAKLLQQVLAEHHDARLQIIFHLWAHEDQPLRVIGDRLNLSIPRVHALLNQALSLLRSEERIQEWRYYR